MAIPEIIRRYEVWIQNISLWHSKIIYLKETPFITYHILRCSSLVNLPPSWPAWMQVFKWIAEIKYITMAGTNEFLFSTNPNGNNNISWFLHLSNIHLRPNPWPWLHHYHAYTKAVAANSCIIFLYLDASRVMLDISFSFCQIYYSSQCVKRYDWIVWDPRICHLWCYLRSNVSFVTLMPFIYHCCVVVN